MNKSVKVTLLIASVLFAVIVAGGLRSVFAPRPEIMKDIPQIGVRPAAAPEASRSLGTVKVAVTPLLTNKYYFPKREEKEKIKPPDYAAAKVSDWEKTYAPEIPLGVEPLRDEASELPPEEDMRLMYEEDFPVEDGQKGQVDGRE